jgi:hypothetical protein
MNIVQKAMTTAAIGAMVSVAIGGPGGLDPAHGRNKSSKMEPPPPEKVKPADGPKVDAPATEYGVNGQILEKPPRDPPSAAADNELCGTRFSRPCDSDDKPNSKSKSPGESTGDTPPSAEYEAKGGGQHLEKPPRENPSIERRAHNGPGGTPPSTAAARNKTGWLIPTVFAGAAGIAAIVLASGGNDNPTSP